MYLEMSHKLKSRCLIGIRDRRLRDNLYDFKGTCRKMYI